MLVIATDGLFDNLYDKDIVSCMKGASSNEIVPSDVAHCLAKKAETLSFDKSYDSPFARNARDAKRNHPGGKKDDITVVVA